MKDRNRKQRWGLVKFSKTTVTHRSSPHCCKQDFSHHLSTESLSALNHSTLILVVLPGNMGENETSDHTPVISFCRGKVHENKDKNTEDVSDCDYGNIPCTLIKLVQMIVLLFLLTQNFNLLSGVLFGQCYLKTPVWVNTICTTSEVFWFISTSSLEMTKQLDWKLSFPISVFLLNFHFY